MYRINNRRSKKGTVLGILAIVILLFVYGRFYISSDKQKYDVIVFGAEPEGISAAISAAKSHKKVLLIEERDGPGGLMTYGMLNSLDMNYDSTHSIVTKGIFLEFYKLIGNRDSFDIEKAQKAFDLLIKRYRITALYNIKSDDVTIIKDNNKITGIKINDVEMQAQMFIDSTPDATFAVKAGASYYIGGEDVNEKDRRMAATLVFGVSNVNWDEVIAYLRNDEDKLSNANEYSAWGYLNVGKSYRPKDKSLRLRGLNLGRLDNGDVLINALQIFNVDGLDPLSKEIAMQKAGYEIPEIVSYLNKKAQGFEKAKLSAIAPELYIRETRHIKGLYRVTVNDLLDRNDFYDKIGVGSYPLDIQATQIDNWGLVIGKPDQYNIPLRSLVSKDVKNLFVVGRSASFSSIAAGSLRVIPVGMVCGEAAGAAASMCIENGVSPEELVYNNKLIEKLQERLKRQGAYIGSFTQKAMYKEDYERSFLEIGVMSGGYSNNLLLDKYFSNTDFVYLLNLALKRSYIDKKYEPDFDIRENLTVKELEKAYKYLTDREINLNKTSDYVTREQGYKIMYEIINILKEEATK